MLTSPSGNFCYDQDCMGRGTCINEADGYSCECEFGFTGHDCQDSLCIDDLVCTNGGVCT